jgi:hypothetical protein
MKHKFKLQIENIDVKFKHLSAPVLNTITNDVGFIQYVTEDSIYIKYDLPEGTLKTNPIHLKWL